MLTSLIADAHFAARRLRARPVYASVAILTLALGVGGTARRRREWAIRIALGLRGSRIVVHVVSHAALLVTGGVGIGVFGAALLARVLSSLLYGVGAIDAVALGAAGTALLGVGMLAAFIPAWRAGMTDPAVVLREQ